MSASANELLAAQAEWTVVTDGSANATATATRAAVAGKVHYITGVSISANATVSTAAAATITSGATTKDKVQIPAAALAPIHKEYGYPIKCASGEAAAVSVGALGASVSATVTIRGFTRTA